MRVGIDLRLYSYRPAGIANYALRLARALADRPDCALTVFQSRRTRRPLTRARTRVLWTPCHHRWEQQVLPLELLAAPIDLLHSPDFIPPFRRRFRSVISVHDLAFRFFPEHLTPESRRYYGQIERALESADAVLTDAAVTRDDLWREFRYPPDRVTVTYLAADEQFRPLPPAAVAAFLAARGLPSEFLLWVGTLEPRKNVATLLRAYALLDDPPSLVLAGQRGWLYDETIALIDALGLADRVVFYRPVAADELPYLYNAARVFVFPSLYEGFGFPPLEAMACGAPVVSSTAGSLAEVVGDAAVPVAPMDPVAMADAIDRVLTDPALAADLRARGLAQAARFSWARCAEETLTVYRRVLAA